MPAPAIFATKATDPGPLVHVRFSTFAGGWEARPARLLTEYPDGRLRVQMLANPQQRCVVHPASVVTTATEA